MKLSIIFAELAAAGYNGGRGMGATVAAGENRLCLDTNYGAYLRVPSLAGRHIDRRPPCVEGGASWGVVDFSLDGVEWDVEHFRDWLHARG